MFCPNCGEKLESQNQKFCASCGSILSYTPDAPQLRAEENQASSPVKPIPVYESKPIKTGGPGPHSKKCFAFAFVSIALAIVGNSFGARFFLPTYFFPYYVGLGLERLIIAMVLHIAGLIFGILSRVNTSKAEILEPINALEQFGSVVAVFGIITNAISVVLVPYRVISLMAIPIYD